MNVVKYPKFYSHNIMFFTIGFLILWSYNIVTGRFIALDTILFSVIINLILLPLVLLILPLTRKGRDHQVYFQRLFALSLFLSIISIIAIIIPASLLWLECGITVPCKHPLMPYLSSEWYSLGTLFLGSILILFWMPLAISQWLYLRIIEEPILKIRQHTSIAFLFIIISFASYHFLALLLGHITD